MGLRAFFSKRRARKKEIHADEQYLDALEIIKESAEIYLKLLAQARQENDKISTERLEKKLNTSFEYFVKNWDGNIKIVHSITSDCYVAPNTKRLELIEVK